METICGSSFWNHSLTWQAESPDLTPCFQETVLIWLPCAFLWLLSPLEIFKIRNSNTKTSRRPDGSQNRVPWTLISILKVILTCILIALSICQLTNVLIRKLSTKQLPEGEINPVFPVEWITPSVQLATYILALTLILADRAYSVSSSGVLFLFWLLLSLGSIVTYYSIFRHLLDPVSVQVENKNLNVKLDEQITLFFSIVILSFKLFKLNSNYNRICC